MAIKRYNSEKDNTIINALRENLSARGTGANLGASDILEIFSIYGQANTSSLEQTRILLQFPVSEISSDRDNNIIPASGSVNFKIKMSNVPHGQTTPKNYTMIVHPIAKAWDEGDGLDMEGYLDVEASNWVSSSANTLWHTTGSDYLSASYMYAQVMPTEYTQSFDTGVEDLEIDITGLAEEWIKHYKGTKTAATGSINFFSKNPTDGNTHASGSITVTGNPSDDGTFTLSETTTSQVFIINTDDNDFDGATDDASGRTPIGILGVLNNNDNIAERIKTALNGQTTVAITATRTNDKINLIQDITGSAGNTEITLTSLSNVTKSDFSDGKGPQTISVYSHEGEKYTYTFITSSTYSINNHVYLELSGSNTATAAALKNRIDSDFAGKITTNIASAFLALTQSVAGLHGNTMFSSSIAIATASVSNFSGGVGMPNYGAIVKLRDDYENGSGKKSYYTKKFYSRSSHEFFLKPQIEAQWDSAVTDDRNYIIKSSSLAPNAENLNSIYLYNRRGGSLVDIPSTGSALVVQLHTSSTGAGTAETLSVAAGVVSGAPTFITASRHSLGIYKAQFAYAGSKTSLYDFWYKSASGTRTLLTSGSAFTVYTEKPTEYYSTPNYNINITNLKDSYLQSEKTTFRVYTRNKNWQPNIYTKATQTAPIDNIKNMYYKVTKISDNYEVISYSTGSTPSYSSLSYDSKGSYFDFDMSLLDKNNAYQISFVFKDGPNYLELPEKFRFRVDP